MKKQIIDFIIRLGLIDRPVQHTAKLSVIRTVLKSNISKCQSYDELLSCEKMFQWYVDKYATEQILPEFKKEIISLLQSRRVLIQLSTTQVSGYGNPI